jgi:nitroreductase
MTTPLSVPDAIRRRRNVRHFAPDPIDDALLIQLIDLTVAAPSSWNFQPWRIVVVRDEARRLLLCDACFRQPQVREAPVSFVFAISHSGWRATLDEVFPPRRYTR